MSRAAATTGGLRLWRSGVLLALITAGLSACPAPRPRSDSRLPRLTPRPAKGTRVLLDAPSPFGRIFVVEKGGQRLLRFGRADGDDQSAYRPGEPGVEPLEYIRAALLGLAWLTARPRILMIGLGGGSFLRHSRRTLPQARLEAVEINPVVLQAARRYFDLGRARPVTVHLRDAVAFVARSKQRYDLIFIDAYDADDYPPKLGTLAFFQAIKGRLAPKGIAVGNLTPNSPAHRQQLLERFGQALGPRRCFLTPEARNTVVIAGPGLPTLTEARLRTRVAALASRSGLPLSKVLGWPCPR